MCPQEFSYRRLNAYPQVNKGVNYQKMLVGILLVFLFSLAYGFTHAQNRSEEYLSVQRWVLPAEATPFSALKLQDDVYYEKDRLFSGWAFERYPNSQLLRAVSYSQGKQNGLMLLWYPDGLPQLSANYKDGALHGRFLGWYNSGGVIYDMMINRGIYAGDSLLDEDDSRAVSEGVDSDKEGPDNDQSPE